MNMELYKGKRKDNGEWIEGFLFCYMGRTLTYAIGTKPLSINIKSEIVGKGTEWFPVEENSICKGTGLKDRDGKNIFELDVLIDTEDETLMAVRWDDEMAKFVLDEYGYKEVLMESGWDTSNEIDVVDTYNFDDFCRPVNECSKIVANIKDDPDLEHMDFSEYIKEEMDY